MGKVQQSEQHNGREPTLAGAYIHLILFGLAGGHCLYLRDYPKARDYHFLGSLSVLPVLSILVYTAAPFSRILTGLALLIAGFATLCLFGRVALDFLLLPSDFETAKINHRKTEPTSTSTHSTILLSRDSQETHQVYHAELNKQRLSLMKAYLWLLAFGVFGEHKSLLNKQYEMMSYCAIASIISWSIGCIVCIYLFLPPTETWLHVGNRSPLAGTFFSMVIIGCRIAAGIAALLLAFKLIIDAVTMPRVVRKFNSLLQNELLNEYVYATKTIAVNEPRSAEATMKPSSFKHRSKA